jgi:hypothetical protein
MDQQDCDVRFVPKADILGGRLEGRSLSLRTLMHTVISNDLGDP